MSAICPPLLLSVYLFCRRHLIRWNPLIRFLSAESFLSDVLAILHALKRNAIDCGVSVVQRKVECLAPAGYAEHASARSDDFAIEQLCAGLKDDGIFE